MMFYEIKKCVVVATFRSLNVHSYETFSAHTAACKMCKSLRVVVAGDLDYESFL